MLKGDELNFSAFTYLREAAKSEDTQPQDQVITWQFTQGNVGMGFGGSEVPASVFQAVNPIYILIFGLVFTALWGFLGNRGLEPSTPVKFAFGLLQLGLGYGCIWFGAVELRRERHGGGRLAAADVPAADDRRAVPVPGGAVHGHQALAHPTGQHGDGDLVPGHGLLAVPGGDAGPVRCRR